MYLSFACYFSCLWSSLEGHVQGFESYPWSLALEIRCGEGRSEFAASFIFITFQTFYNPLQAETQTPHLPTTAKFASGAVEKPRFTHPCLK